MSGMGHPHHPHHHHNHGQHHQHRHQRYRQGSPTHRPHPDLPGYEEMAEKYGVNLPQWEVIKNPLYDSAPYAAAGVQTITLFQNQQGQGVGFGGGSKTLSDTNMTAGGHIPQNQSFLIQAIDIAIQPSTPSAGGVSAQLPAAYGAQAAALLVNDVYIIGRSGNVRLHIGSKDYVDLAPVGRLPSRVNFHVAGAFSDSTTAGATQQNRLAFGNWIGHHFEIHPASLRLEENQNFDLTLNWPEGLQAITNPARIFVYLIGLLYRKAQ